MQKLGIAPPELRIDETITHWDVFRQHWSFHQHHMVFHPSECLRILGKTKNSEYIVDNKWHLPGKATPWVR